MSDTVPPIDIDDYWLLPIIHELAHAWPADHRESLRLTGKALRALQSRADVKSKLGRIAGDYHAKAAAGATRDRLTAHLEEERSITQALASDRQPSQRTSTTPQFLDQAHQAYAQIESWLHANVSRTALQGLAAVACLILITAAIIHGSNAAYQRGLAEAAKTITAYTKINLNPDAPTTLTDLHLDGEIYKIVGLTDEYLITVGDNEKVERYFRCKATAATPAASANATPGFVPKPPDVNDRVTLECLHIRAPERQSAKIDKLDRWVEISGWSGGSFDDKGVARNRTEGGGILRDIPKDVPPRTFMNDPPRTFKDGQPDPAPITKP